MKHKYRLQEIDERWNEEMLSLIDRAPIKTKNFHLILDRRPDVFLLPKLVSERIQCVGVFLEDQLLGFAILLYHRLIINKKRQDIIYFSNLVIDPAAHRKGLATSLVNYFVSSLSKYKGLGYGVIMIGNSAAQNITENYNLKFSNLLYSKVIGNWEVKSILFAYNKRTIKSYLIRQAKIKDIEEILRLMRTEYNSRLFGPIVTRERIEKRIKILPDFNIENYYLAEKDEKVVGVCCAYDLGLVKRNKIVSYGIKIRWLVALINIIGFLFKFPKLPSEGQPLREVTITHCAVKDRNPNIVRALLQRIYTDYRRMNYHTVLFGHSSNDPIGIATKSFFTHSVKSQIIIYSNSKKNIDNFKDTSYPLIDMHYM